MVDLVPAPDTLHLASPALGPWFRFGGTASGTPPTPPTLPIPTSAALALPVALVQDMEWRAPANALRSYHVATASRPPALRGLRKPDGTHAFAENALVVLITLLPEVELRLWALTQILAQPDGSPAPAANIPTRPRIRRFAFEIAPGTIASLDALEAIRSADFASDLDSDDKKAAYLGLNFGGGIFGNAAQPTSELLRPKTDQKSAIRPRSGALNGSLWCFDHRGRAVDPGAVAAWYTEMASPTNWSNLWANSNAADQVTASVSPGRLVQLVSAHEGPLEPGLRIRFNTSDLTTIGASDFLYTAGTAPTITLTTAATPDTAPLPRVAALPNGSYQPPATATPFAGWTDAATAFPMARDYMRVALVDMEAHLIGLTRADPGQSDPRLRNTPGRNILPNPMLATSDAVTAAIMASLAAGDATAIAPVMDTHWGANQPGPLTATLPLPDALEFSVRGLTGAGTSAGDTSADQSILVQIAAGDLAADAWLRIWPHGVDTDTGQRFRQDGGAARIAATGSSFLVLPLPDGRADGEMSFDALVVTSDGARLYPDLAFNRPALLPGTAVTLPPSPELPPDTSLWICEQGITLTRAANTLRSGETVLVVPNDPDSAEFALVDPASLAASDFDAATLENAVDAADTLITTTPAFAITPGGDLDPTTGPNGATRIHRTRSLFDDLPGMGRPLPSMERLEAAALELSSNTGAIGATPAHATSHEAPPAQLGHPGVPATTEISGPGLALAGPASDALEPLLRERQAGTLAEFLGVAHTPLTPAPDPGGTTTWTAILETVAHGVVGDITIRTYLDNVASHTPGQDWIDLKAQIQTATGINIDSILDTSGFTAIQQAALAQALDSVIARTRDGAAGFAAAAQAAITRAEDFIYLQTPAIDALTAGSAAVDIIGAIKSRWSARPNLVVMLCVPEKWLPKRATKLDDLRKAGVAAALKSLKDTGGDRVILFTPTAGSGRALHMASTVAIIDDAILLVGSTHLWRRGLTFDSSIAGAVFDENVSSARPVAVRTARAQLMANMLAVPTTLIPDDPGDCLEILTQLIAGTGLGRVKTGVYAPANDPTSIADQAIWNPDGRPGLTNNWFVFLAAIAGAATSDSNNAIR